MSDEKIIEFKPAPIKHTLRRKRHVYEECDHRQLCITDGQSKITCDLCKKEIDPLKAVIILADGLWWEEHRREAQLEYDTKRVTKVQAAAIEHLYAAGITPEKYAARWVKEDEKRKVVELARAEKETKIKTMTPNGAA